MHSTESVYVACNYAYVTSEKTSTANELYITESVYIVSVYFTVLYEPGFMYVIFRIHSRRLVIS